MRKARPIPPQRKSKKAATSRAPEGNAVTPASAPPGSTVELECRGSVADLHRSVAELKTQAPEAMQYGVQASGDSLVLAAEGGVTARIPAATSTAGTAVMPATLVDTSVADPTGVFVLQICSQLEGTRKVISARYCPNPGEPTTAMFAENDPAVLGTVVCTEADEPGSDSAAEKSVPTLETRAADVHYIDIGLVDSHPDNPRCRPDEELVDGLAEGMKRHGFGKEHAVLVRPMSNGRYQLVSGHRRFRAALKAGLQVIPAWVREMSDEEAIEQLAYANVQDRLSKIEIALHSLRIPKAQGKKGQGLAAYARRFGLQLPDLIKYQKGAEVFAALRDVPGSEKFLAGCHRKAQHLARIYEAPKEHWFDLVARCVEGKWTADVAEEAVKALLPKQDEGTVGSVVEGEHGSERQPAGVEKPAVVEEPTASGEPGVPEEPAAVEEPESAAAVDAADEPETVKAPVADAESTSNDEPEKPAPLTVLQGGKSDGLDATRAFLVAYDKLVALWPNVSIDSIRTFVSTGDRSVSIEDRAANLKAFLDAQSSNSNAPAQRRPGTRKPMPPGISRKSKTQGGAA